MQQAPVTSNQAPASKQLQALRYRFVRRVSVSHKQAPARHEPVMQQAPASKHQQALRYGFVRRVSVPHKQAPARHEPVMQQAPVTSNQAPASKHQQASSCKQAAASTSIQVRS